MNVLMTILYILLFIVCLSVLIMIHELGHFTAAKIFKVYVLEYSIGFGPALIHKKPKNGETYFSLRVVPFGGYVSMYGEGVELEDGQTIDESRSLEGIKKWKRAIIMAAGVTMNALLALTLFFVYEVGFDKSMCYYANMTIEAGSKAEAAGLKTLDVLAVDSYVDSTKKKYTGEYHLIDESSVVTYADATTETVFTYLDLNDFSNYNNLNINDFMTMFGSKVDGEEIVPNYSNRIDVNANFVSVLVNFKTMELNEEETDYVFTDHPVLIEKGEKGLEYFGYKLYLDVQKPLPFGKAIGQSFVDFGNASTIIVRAFATMFTKETWNSMGGIIAVGFQTTSVLQNFGVGKFIYLWGALSVNLAIVNLFPFPGLDGWQLLVLAVEGIFRKKIPNKVKTIVSIIGIGLLFAFMIVLVFKDLFTFIF